MSDLPPRETKLALPEVERGFRAAFGAFDDPVSVFTRDGRYIYINPAGKTLLGLAESELLGRTYLEVFPELGTHPYHQAFTKVATETSRAERLEFYYPPMDRWSSQRIFASGDHVFVVWEDITERKRVENELQASISRADETERQFQTMIEAMPQLAWRAKPDGYIDYYNPRWFAYTGTSPPDMEGWGWQSVHDPVLLPSVMQRWQQSIATGAPFEMEFPLRRHDGVFRWFLTRVTPYRDDTGMIIRWFGINTDIDDQKRALALVENTLESMSDAFFVIDRAWRIVRVNRNYERVSATSRERAVGQVLWELFPAAAEPTSKYWLEFHRVMEERCDAHFEESYAPLDLWTEVDAFPSPDGGVAVFFRDISERKRSERERTELLEREQAARVAAEAASRAKDEFLAMLGHELRNPLAPITTALELMRARGSNDGDRERAVIERQVTHLVRLVDDLLDVSRITRGSVELSRQTLDMSELVAHAIETASPLIEQRGHRLEANVPSGLFVDGDGHRLGQVISNLLANAAKYTPPRGRIQVTAEREQEAVVLRISDNGNGIANDLLPRVFDLFVQGRQTIDRSVGGVGLGLTIVRRLVELHGGRVTAASPGLGQGSVFSVYLPAVSGESTPPESTPPHAARPEQRTKRRILIVDDNEDAADLLSQLLESRGYTTQTAYDGPSALKVLDTFHPDCAVLDIGLPVMDGYELAQLIRQRRELQGMRLLALTGYGQANDRERTARAGFDEHLVKPIDPNRLVALLEAPPKVG